MAFAASSRLVFPHVPAPKSMNNDLDPAKNAEPPVVAPADGMKKSSSAESRSLYRLR